MTPATTDDTAGPARATSWAQLARSVAWGLLGVRKASAHEGDLARVQPLRLVAAALLGLIVLVALLAGLAHWVAGGL